MLEEAIYHAEKALRDLLARDFDLGIASKLSIYKALQGVVAYPTLMFTGHISITVSSSYTGGGSGYASVRVGEQGLILSTGGSVYDPAVGSDSISRDDFAHYRATGRTEGKWYWESWEETWYMHLPGDDQENSTKAYIEDCSGLLIDQQNVSHLAAETFGVYADQLPALFAELEACAPATRGELMKKIQKGVPGVYAFYECDKAVYVGRTRNLRRRLGEHGQESSTHSSASFAFLRARREVEKKHDLKGLSRQFLAREHPIFSKLFREEKQAVAKMTVRWVLVEDAVTQALLEVYAALALGTEFNSFVTS